MIINRVSTQNVIARYQANVVDIPQLRVSKQEKDQVVFSEKAVSFSKVMNQVKAENVSHVQPTRQARIDDISARIKSGQYEIDCKQVATKMISNAIAK